MYRGLLLVGVTALAGLAETGTTRGFVNMRLFNRPMLSKPPKTKMLPVKPADPPPCLHIAPQERVWSKNAARTDPKMVRGLSGKTFDEGMMKQTPPECK